MELCVSVAPPSVQVNTVEHGAGEGVSLKSGPSPGAPLWRVIPEVTFTCLGLLFVEDF